jgi:hypothetical protein
LVHAGEIATAKLGASELEKAPCTVEGLPKAGWRQLGRVTGQIDVETSLEIFPQTPRNNWIGHGAKMRRDVTPRTFSRKTAGPRSQLSSP